MQRPDPPKAIAAKGYEPTQVEWLSLRTLHQRFDFLTVLHVPASFETPDLTLFQFRRPDRSVLHYCPAILDVRDAFAAPGHPDLSTWLIYIQSQLSANVIKPHDVIVAPLLQVQLGRRHFNTLAIFIENSHQYNVFIIEPRDNNMTKHLRYYPVNTLGERIANQLGEQVKFFNIKIGQQSLIDDVSCGKHQINYTEVLAGLPAAFFQNPVRLKKILKQVSMVRRLLDEENLVRMRSAFVLEDNWDSILAKTQTQQMLQGTFKVNADLAVTRNTIFEILQRYIQEFPLRFGLFKKHTRHLTGVALLALLRDLTHAALERPQEVHYKMTEVLFAFYSSIKSPESQLRLTLEEMLTELLKANGERAAVRKQYSSASDRALKLEAYFFDRLVNLRIEFDIHPERLHAIYKAVRAVNRLDKGVKENDLKSAGRVEMFTTIQNNLNALLILPAAPRP